MRHRFPGSILEIERSRLPFKLNGFFIYFLNERMSTIKVANVIINDNDSYTFITHHPHSY